MAEFLDCSYQHVESEKWLDGFTVSLTRNILLLPIARLDDDRYIRYGCFCRDMKTRPIICSTLPPVIMIIINSIA